MIKINLRDLMWQKNISAKKINDEVGIGTTTISNIIHGKHKNVGLDIIDKLCEVLDCRIQDLLEFERNNK